MLQKLIKLNWILFISGGKLVDPTPQVERELKQELDRVTRQLGGAEGADMTKFPDFKFEEPKIDVIDNVN